MATAPVRQQLVEEEDRDAPPDDSQEQDVYIGLPVFPICPVEDEFAWLSGRKERQNHPGNVGWLDGMPVKEAFHAADDGGVVRASGEARGEFGMPDVLAPKECEDHERKQLDLVLAELREVRGEAAGQLGEDIGRRVLFSRVSRTFSSPRESVCMSTIRRGESVALKVSALVACTRIARSLSQRHHTAALRLIPGCLRAQSRTDLRG